MEQNVMRKPRKISFSDVEWEEIKAAVREGGFKNTHDMFLYLIQQRKEMSNDTRCSVEMTVREYAELNSCLNQIRCGINVEQNMKKVNKRVDGLCREFM